MQDNEVLRARRGRILPEHIKETPAETFNRLMVDIAGAVAVLGAVLMVIWAVAKDIQL